MDETESDEEGEVPCVWNQADNLPESSASDYPGLSGMKRQCGIKNEKDSNILNQAHNLPESSASGYPGLSGMDRQCGIKNEENCNILNQADNLPQSSDSDHPGLSRMNKKCAIKNEENSNILNCVSNNLPDSSASDHPGLSGRNKQFDVKNEESWNILNQADSLLQTLVLIILCTSSILNLANYFLESPASDHPGLSGMDRQFDNKSEENWNILNQTCTLTQSSDSDHPGLSGRNKHFDIKNEESWNVWNQVDNLLQFFHTLNLSVDDRTYFGFSVETLISIIMCASNILLNLVNYFLKSSASDHPGLSRMNKKHGIRNVKSSNLFNLISDNLFFPFASDYWSLFGVSKHCDIKNEEYANIFNQTGNLPESSASDHPGLNKMNRKCDIKNEENLNLYNQADNLHESSALDHSGLSGMNKQSGIKSDVNSNMLNRITDSLTDSSVFSHPGLSGMNKKCGIKSEENWNMLKQADKLPESSTSEYSGLSEINEQCGFKNKKDCNMLKKADNLPDSSASDYSGLSRMNKECATKNEEDSNKLNVINNNLSNSLASDHPGLSVRNTQFDIKNEESLILLNQAESSASDHPGLSGMNKKGGKKSDESCNVLDLITDNLPNSSASDNPGLSRMNRKCGIINVKSRNIFYRIKNNLPFSPPSDYWGSFGVSKHCVIKNEEYRNIFNQTGNLPESSASHHNGLNKINRKCDMKNEENGNIFNQADKLHEFSASDHSGLFGRNKQRGRTCDVSSNMFNRITDNLPDPSDSDHPCFSRTNKSEENWITLNPITVNLPHCFNSDHLGLSEMNEECGITNEEIWNILNPASESSASDHSGLFGMNRQCGIKNVRNYNIFDLISDNLPFSSPSDYWGSLGVSKQCDIRKEEYSNIFNQSDNITEATVSDHRGFNKMNRKCNTKKEENGNILNHADSFPESSTSDHPGLFGKNRQCGIKNVRSYNILDLISDNLPFSSPSDYWGLFGVSKQCNIKNEEHSYIFNHFDNLPESSASDHPGVNKMNRKCDIRKEENENIFNKADNLPDSLASDHPSLSAMSKQQCDTKKEESVNIFHLITGNLPDSSASNHPGSSGMNKKWGIKYEVNLNIMNWAHNIPDSSTVDHPGLSGMSKQCGFKTEIHSNIFNQTDNLPESSDSDHPGLNKMSRKCGIKSEENLIILNPDDNLPHSLASDHPRLFGMNRQCSIKNEENCNILDLITGNLPDFSASDHPDLSGMNKEYGIKKEENLIIFDPDDNLSEFLPSDHTGLCSVNKQYGIKNEENCNILDLITGNLPDFSASDHPGSPGMNKQCGIKNEENLIVLDPDDNLPESSPSDHTGLCSVNKQYIKNEENCNILDFITGSLPDFSASDHPGSPGMNKQCSIKNEENLIVLDPDDNLLESSPSDHTGLCSVSKQYDIKNEENSNILDLITGNITDFSASDHPCSFVMNKQCGVKNEANLIILDPDDYLPEFSPSDHTGLCRVNKQYIENEENCNTLDLITGNLPDFSASNQPGSSGMNKQRGIKSEENLIVLDLDDYLPEFSPSDHTGLCRVNEQYIENEENCNTLDLITGNLPDFSASNQPGSSGMNKQSGIKSEENLIVLDPDDYLPEFSPSDHTGLCRVNEQYIENEENCNTLDLITSNLPDFSPSDHPGSSGMNKKCGIKNEENLIIFDLDDNLNDSSLSDHTGLCRVNKQYDIKNEENCNILDLITGNLPDFSALDSPGPSGMNKQCGIKNEENWNIMNQSDNLLESSASDHHGLYGINTNCGIRNKENLNILDQADNLPESSGSYLGLKKQCGIKNDEHWNLWNQAESSAEPPECSTSDHIGISGVDKQCGIRNDEILHSGRKTEEGQDGDFCRCELKPISFDSLIKLITKLPDEILLEMSNSLSFKLLMEDADEIDVDRMALVIIAFGKMCTNNLRQTFYAFLNYMIGKTHFFVNSLPNFLKSFCLESAQDYHLESLSWLLVFLQELQSVLPAASSNVVFLLLPLLRTKYEMFLKSCIIYDNIMELLREIEVHNAYLIKQTNSKIKTSSKKRALQLVKPPDSFRSLPIFPTIDDIYCNAFLRPNIVTGKYSNTEHYLDVQYRLLREDYVRPLRDGITEYLRRKSIRNCQGAKVYENVRIVEKEFVKGALCHLVYFSDEEFSAMNWESNKCFLSGSLLCLSSDGFRTMLLATVARRDVDQLKNGLLLVQFEENTLDGFNISPMRHFVVIETSAYFEAYRHNLKALQELSEDALPLKEYIIDVKTDVGHPRYLDRLTTYDMRPLLVPMDFTHIKRKMTANGKISFRYEFPNECDVGKSVKILSYSSWPSATDLNLESSQYLALRAALTREFAIIQGPPGTGKTYVGLRIVQLLLHNKDKWFTEETNSLPILVVCSTNHALDQFLEGMATFTDKIVRIGGGGKNEAIYRFLLNHLKRMPNHKDELPEHIQTNLRHILQQIRSVERNIEELSSLLLKCTKNVLNEEDLMNFIPRTQYLSLKSIVHNKDFEPLGLNDNGLIVYDWLGICPRLGWNHFHNLCQDFDEVVDQVASFERAFEKMDNEIEGVGEFLPSSRKQSPDAKKEILKYIKNCLNKSKALAETEALKILNVWDLELCERWNLYKYWLNKFVDEKQNECSTLQAVLKTLHEDLCEIKTEEDIHVVKRADVVGMTTTGAAKYRHVVRSVNPQILIVEEAAEILESHIVTALAPHTQHVILIGDHKQLRPSPTVHQLAVGYDANISLFERMIENEMDYFTLSMQHRMRPDITDLIVPHIYSGLRNHSSVTEYENIKGVGKNRYFVTHDYNETPEKDSKSKSNEHEATFMIRLCHYLVQQGYDASQVTVLTTYNAQLSVMKKMAEAFPRIEDVRFTVVDNYQGEENDIILISLVRSNVGGEIGFLKVANRVCVALSRAKKGLYCIGNFELLAEKSDLWKNITETLKQKGDIGKSLPLSCQNHPNTFKEVSTGKHFDSMPEGGCSKLCEYHLPCDHVCPLMCHPYDQEHLNVHCFEKCNRKCENGHACPRKCYEKCDPCEFTVSYRYPECGHTVQFPCSKQSRNTTCDAKCDRKFICGHTCPKKCGEICPESCRDLLTFKSPICGHVVSVACHKKYCSGELMNKCHHPCDVVLKCGHRCKGNCAECRQGRLHVACQQPCRRTLICGHKCKFPCAVSCPPCQLPCENRCIHRKCPRKCSEPCDICLERCEWHCEHIACARLCGELCSRAPCNEPCGRSLKCGHPCIGFCSEPCPEECRVCDSEVVREIFFGTEDEDDARFVRLEECNHIFEVSGLNEWMMTKDEIVQMKVCPKCKTAIRRNLRFGNVVKDCLESVEKVKEKIFGNVDSSKRWQQSLLSLVEENAIFSSGPFSYLKNILTDRGCRNIQEVTSMENVIKISLQLADISNFEQVSSVIEGTSAITHFVQSSKSWVVDFMRDEIFTASEQQLGQLAWEVRRLKLSSKFVDFAREHTIEFPNRHFEDCVHILTSYCSFGESSAEKFSDSYQALQASDGSLAINVLDMEKNLNLKAMDLSVGHWYQCPNGHVYCTAEGESSMERCDECTAEIAGSNDERVATEEVNVQNNVLPVLECHF